MPKTKNFNWHPLTKRIGWNSDSDSTNMSVYSASARNWGDPIDYWNCRKLKSEKFKYYDGLIQAKNCRIWVFSQYGEI